MTLVPYDAAPKLYATLPDSRIPASAPVDDSAWQLAAVGGVLVVFAAAVVVVVLAWRHRAAIDSAAVGVAAGGLRAARSVGGGWRRWSARVADRADKPGGAELP